VRVTPLAAREPEDWNSLAGRRALEVGITVGRFQKPGGEMTWDGNVNDGAEPWDMVDGYRGYPQRGPPLHRDHSHLQLYTHHLQMLGGGGAYAWAGGRCGGQRLP
jgi:hypothetical protein